MPWAEWQWMTWSYNSRGAACVRRRCCSFAYLIETLPVNINLFFKNLCALHAHLLLLWCVCIDRCTEMQMQIFSDRPAACRAAYLLTDCWMLIKQAYLHTYVHHSATLSVIYYWNWSPLVKLETDCHDTGRHITYSTPTCLSAMFLLVPCPRQWK